MPHDGTAWPEDCGGPTSRHPASVPSWLDRQLARAQGAIFWSVLGIVLASSLWLGANRPAAWMLLALAALTLFAFQAFIDRGDVAAFRLWRRVLAVALPYLAVIIWAAVQATPLPLQALTHPAWAQLPEVHGTISADPWATWQGVLRLSAYAALFWIAARAAADPGRVRRMVDVIAWFSIMLALYGIGALAAGVNPITGPPAYENVVTASFVNRNAYAYYAGIGAMACLTALVLRMPADDRRLSPAAVLEIATGKGAVFLAGFVLLEVTVLMTGSRTGSVAAFAGTALVLGLSLGPKIGPLWVFASLLLLGLTGLVAVPNELVERLTMLDPLDDKRIHIFALVIDGITDLPWRGHGLGAFPDAFRAYLKPEVSGAEWDKAHNSYLEFAFELGLPAALVLLLAIALIALRLVCGLGQRRRMRPLLAFGLGILLAGGLHALVDFSVQMPATGALMAIILGAGYALSDRSGQRQGASAAGPRTAQLV